MPRSRLPETEVRLVDIAVSRAWKTMDFRARVMEVNIFQKAIESVTILKGDIAR